MQDLYEPSNCRNCAVLEHELAELRQSQAVNQPVQVMERTKQWHVRWQFMVILLMAGWLYGLNMWVNHYPTIVMTPTMRYVIPNQTINADKEIVREF